MSVCTRSARWKRTAQPRGSAFGSLSGITGMPVELEKRTETGVAGRFKWGALLSAAASAVGVNDPFSMMPLACAGRKPGCTPNRASNFRSISLLRATIFSSVGSGMDFLLKLRIGYKRQAQVAQVQRRRPGQLVAHKR